MFGLAHRRAAGVQGLTILTAMANVCDHLQSDGRIAPLYHGLAHVASDSAGQPPKFPLQPLGRGEVEWSNLSKWFRDMVAVRSVDGAERCLLTAIERGAEPSALADMMLLAATDHFYLDGGHTVDFINKAFELLDRIGWEHAGEVLLLLFANCVRLSAAKNRMLGGTLLIWWLCQRRRFPTYRNAWAKGAEKNGSVRQA